MLFSLLCMPGHLPLVFPCRLEGMPVKEADGKLIWSRDVNADNLLTENRLTKFLQTHSVRTEVLRASSLMLGLWHFPPDAHRHTESKLPSLCRERCLR